MTFKDGDFIEVEYTTRDAATNEVIATTDEKLAKQSNLHEEGAVYGPTLVVPGSGGVIKGLDREIRNMSVGESKKFTFKPEDAFGERSEELVRVMPLSDFRARDINPYPGMRIRLENTSATVKSVNSGRVVIDANHPYAGRDISYEIKIVKEIKDDKEKVMALGKSYDAVPTSVAIDGKAVTLTYGTKVNKNANYLVAKANLIASILALMKNIDKVDVKEEYERPAEKEGAQAKDEESKGPA